MDERLLAATRTPGDLVGFAVQLDPREFGDPRAPFPGHVFLDTGEVMTADVTLSDEAVEDIFQLAPDAIRDGAAEETICLWLVQGRLRGHHLHIEAADWSGHDPAWRHLFPGAGRARLTGLQ